MRDTKKHRAGVVAILALIVTSILIYGCQTDFFKIKIKIINILTTEGNSINAKVYIPEDASSENRKATIITTGGGDNEYVMVDMINTELSRRGYVVVSYSPYNHGTSDIVATDDYGASEVIQYVKTLGFVDSSNIGVMGHSRAAANTLKTVYPGCQVKAVLSIEYVPELNALHDYDSDTAINIGLIGNRYNEYVTDPLGFLTSEELMKTFGTTEIIPDTEYGNIAKSTFRKVYLVNSTDTGYAFSQKVIEDIIDFFDTTLQSPEVTESRGYIWKYIEILSLIALLSMFVMVLELMNWLTKRIIGKITQASSLNVLYSNEEKRHSRLLMYGGILTGAVSYIPLYMLGKRILSANIIFPQNSTNGQLIWAFFMSLTEAGIILFCRKKKSLSPIPLDEMILAQTKEIIKYFCIAALTFVSVYITLLIKRGFWGQTYNFLGLNLSVINCRKLLAGTTYWPVFAVYFMISGIYQIRFCSFDTENKGRDIWNGILFQTLGMLGLLLINLSGFLFCDRALFHWGRFAFGPINYMIFMLPFVGIVNSISYRRTGKIYLGAFMNAFLFTWLFLSCNAFYYS